jgi:hypothetical protein
VAHVVPASPRAEGARTEGARAERGDRGEESALKLAALEREVKRLGVKLAAATARRRAAAQPASSRPASPDSKAGLRVHYDRKNNVVDVWLPPVQGAPAVQIRRRPQPQEKDSE